jgi:hypothetical protein
VKGSDDAAASTSTGETVPRRAEPPPPDPSSAAVTAAVAAAEDVAEACWRLVRVLSAAGLPPDAVHEVAGRLLGAADALGVVARTTAGDALSGGAIPRGCDSPWKAADQGLASVFHHLYFSIPDEHPARRWFIRYAEEG